MLKNLGIENKALGFLAGFTGKEAERILNSKGVDNNFIYIDEGFTRINVKIKNTEGETEINACGPYIKKQYIDMLLEKRRHYSYIGFRTGKRRRKYL